MISLAETLIATTILVTVTGGVLGILDPAMGAFDTQPELADVQQRLRVGVVQLQNELAMAGPPVLPYRSGLESPDPPGTFHQTVISTNGRVYYLHIDRVADSYELMRYDGEHTTMPVVDNVVKLEFRYFADGAAELTEETLTDGPWHPDDLAAGRFDADLLRIRRIRVAMRVQAAPPWLRSLDAALFANPGTATGSRQVPDQEVTFDVAPRNMNLNR